MTERARWVALMALLLLTPLAFYPGLVLGQLPLLQPWESGYAEFLRVEAVSQVLSAQAPLWSSGHLAGVPLIEDPRSALLSPQSWLTWLLGAPLARGACAWLFTALAGLGTLLWGRALGLAPGAALVGAVLAQANPGLHLGLVEGAAATVWLLPWCLLALERGRLRGGPWLSLALAAALGAGDLLLGGGILLFLGAYWLRRGAQIRLLVAIAGGVLLSAPMTLPALAAWVSGDLAAQTWPHGLGPGLAATLSCALWGAAAAVALAVQRWLAERLQAGAGALSLVLGVLACGPMRALGEPAPVFAGELPQGRSLGLEGVPLMALELRGGPLWTSVQAQRFGAMLDPDAEQSGLWVGSINAQNRKVLEFAGVRSVVAEGALFGLAPLAESGGVSVYALDGGPRAWMTPGGRPAANEREALDFLRTGYAFREAPAIQDLERRLPTDGVITPLQVQDQGAQVRVEIPAGSGAGVLVLADRWEPEWQVLVDGQAAELLQVGGLFRGVMLPTGAQEVVFEYRLWSWGWGLGLGLLGLLLTLGVAIRRPR